MADGNERLAADVKPPASSVPAHGQVASVLKAEPDGQENNHGNDHGLTEELKRRLDETRLPASLKEQILAQLPSAQEQERLYRSPADGLDHVMGFLDLKSMGLIGE